MASGGSCAERMAQEAALPRRLPFRRPQQPPLEQKYDFVEEPAREFFCAVSLELLREPQQTDCCGHHLSVEVAQRLQGEGKPCPMCQHPHFTTHPDIFHRRKVQQLTVRCQHKKNGCDWVGELGNLEDHVTKCPKQPWQCVYCAFSGLREGEKDHLSGCGQFPVPCPNGCEAGSVERCRLEWHLLECPLQLVGCEYAAMGCAVRLPRREMSEHIRQSGQEHLLKMCAVNLTVSRELSRKVEEKEQQIAELREEMRRMEGRVEEMERMEERVREEKREMEGRVEENRKEMERRMVERMREEMGGMEGRMREGMREMEGRVKEEKREMEGRVVKEMERKAVEIVREEVARMREMEGGGRDGDTKFPIEYTIHNFSALKDQDKGWRSPPFYSHRGGYKMCIEVWPNGISNAKRSAVSILYYVMRDANTEGLRWPVTLEVNTSVMNQVTKGWEDLNEQTQYQFQSHLQEKPSRESVLSFWNPFYLNHNGFYRQQYIPQQRRNYQQHFPYTNFVKDDCLQMKVTSFAVTYK